MIDFVLIYILIIEDLVHNSSESDTWVKLDPGRREHEVNMAFVLVRPEFNDSTKIELANDFMRFNQCVHVGFEAMLSIDALLVKFDLDEAVRVRSDNKVNFSPINHNDFLHIIHDIW